MTNASKNVSIQEAFRHAQTAFRAAKLDKANTHFKSKYATLKSVQEACYGPLHEHGISVHFGVVWGGETVQPYAVKCQLVKGEESLSTMVPCNFQGSPQQQMSALTYAKRAALSAITGIILDDESDDDGNDAEKAPASKSSGKQAGSEKPSFKKIMGDIKNCTDMNRLNQIQKYVIENANTSKEKLLEMILEREHDLAQRANDMEDHGDD